MHFVNDYVTDIIILVYDLEGKGSVKTDVLICF